MRHIIVLILVLNSVNVWSQVLMNIYRTNQPLVQIPINDIDSITYSAVGNPGALAVVTTIPMGAFTASTAELGGIVDGNGGTIVTQRGVAWSTYQAPTIGDYFTSDGSGTGQFQSILEGLSVDSVYYARAYAINSAGVAYGNEVVFQVSNDNYLPGPGVTDIDGNFYETFFSSSGQEWMKENLKTCRYATGDSILHIEGNLDWSVATEGAWVGYNDNEQHIATFGKLYNGWAVEDPRNVCPSGWHVPSENDWNELHAVNGGYAYGGGSLKSTGIAIWLSPNAGATNSSGLSALPGGRRLAGGDFQEMLGSGFWWTSTGNSTTLNNRALYYTSNSVWNSTPSKLEGHSIRCVKD